MNIGMAIAIFGLILSLGSYIIIENIPLTAMGIGLIIIGIAWFSLPPYPIPRKAILDIIESSCSNIESFLEFIGVNKRAIYLPSNGKVVAYVSLIENENPRNISFKEIADNIDRFIIKQGKCLGFTIIPPSIKLDNINPETNIEAILDYVLVEYSEIAESVKAIKSEDGFIVEVNKVRVDINYPRFKIVMGSLPSCLIAQIIALIFSKPVQIIDEKYFKDKIIIQLRVLDWIEKAST
ncbi:MAG: hypothetical protein QXW62_05860 [Candidatus Methanomethylicaceae archaeon]|nr:hypothetical protein [Candidatus Verstraetearchaeota archaeon]